MALELNFFLASHSNFNLHSFDCDWVGAIHKKQPLRRYQFSFYSVNHYVCDENFLDLLPPVPELSSGEVLDISNKKQPSGFF